MVGLFLLMVISYYYKAWLVKVGMVAMVGLSLLMVTIKDEVTGVPQHGLRNAHDLDLWHMAFHGSELLTSPKAGDLLLGWRQGRWAEGMEHEGSSREYTRNGRCPITTANLPT